MLVYTKHVEFTFRAIFVYHVFYNITNTFKKTFLPCALLCYKYIEFLQSCIMLNVVRKNISVSFTFRVYLEDDDEVMKLSTESQNYIINYAYNQDLEYTIRT